MKKLYFLVLLFTTVSHFTKAQNAAAYIFSTNTGVSLESISTGSTSIVGSGIDDQSSAVVNLNFSFLFNGINYTQFSASSNGLFGLGSSPVNEEYYDYAFLESATYPIFSAWAEDLHTASDGGVKYKVLTQANGLKKLVIEWNVKSYTDRASVYNKTCQVWLFEGSNKIQFVYGSATDFRYNNAAIGIASSSSDFNTVNAVDHTSDNVNGTTINNVWPGEGRSYTFSQTATPALDPITVGAGTSNNISCNGANNGSITLGAITGGDGQYIITWAGPNGYTASTSLISDLSAGTYNYSVTDNASSAPATGEVTISEPSAQLASITASGETTFCEGSSVDLTASTGSSYLWSNGSTTQTITVNATGDYSVAVTNENGCSSTSSTVSVNVSSSPIVTITPSGSVAICAGSSVTLTASGANSYVWSTGATTASISTSSAGSYTVKGTNANGCAGTSATVTTTENFLPVTTITVGSDKNLLCAGLPLTATSSNSGSSFVWSNGSTESTINLTNENADGVYSVKATDANGCTSSSSAKYNYNKQNLLGSYTLVAYSSISLGSGTTVSKGSVGLLSSSGTISLGQYASVAAPGAVVKAKYITKQYGVNAPTLVYAPASVALPAMQFNTSNANYYSSYTVINKTITLALNYKTLVIKGASNVTLTGNVFGSIIIESGSTVKFTNSTISIDKLTVSSSNATAGTALTNVLFANGGAVKISSSIVIGGRSRINTDDRDVTFYCSDVDYDSEVFTVNGSDIQLSGTIYLPIGTLAVTGKNGAAVKMKGLFMAQKITSSGSNVTWQSFDCNIPSTSARYVVSSQVIEPSTENEVSTMKVYPTLTTGRFTVQIPENAAVSNAVFVMDINGRVITQQVAASRSINFNLSNQPAGLYLIKMLNNGKIETARVVIQK